MPGKTPTFGSTLNTSFGTGNPYAPNAALQSGGMQNVNTGSATAGGAAGGLTGLAGMSTGNQWYGNSPIATAQAASERSLGKNLAALRERYGAQGLGQGSDQAQAEGTAIGEASTGLGAQLAQLGVGARQGDISNAINAQQGAGQLGLGQGNLGLGQIGAYGNQTNTALSAQLGAGQQNLAGQELDLNRANALANQGNTLTGIGAGEQNIPNANAIAAWISSLVSGTTTGGGSGSSKTGPPGIG